MTGLIQMPRRRSNSPQFFPQSINPALCSRLCHAVFVRETPVSSPHNRAAQAQNFWCYLVLFGALWRYLVLKLFFDDAPLWNQYHRLRTITHRYEPVRTGTHRYEPIPLVRTNSIDGPELPSR